MTSTPTSTRTRALWTLLGTLVVVGIGAAAWLAPTGNNGPARVERGSGRSQTVTAGVVKRQDVAVLVNAIGTVTAANTVQIKSKVDGELKALHFSEGQAVRAGQLLAEIDPGPYQIALNQAEGVLARDQAQLRNAKLDLERYRDLAEKDAIPKQQRDTQETLVNQLQGTVQADQAQVANAKLQLSYTRISAPIAGRAGLRQIDLGNQVRAADITPLLTITQTQPVFVVFAVPDQHLPKIRRGLQAGLKVEAWDRELKTRLAEGTIAAIDNAIDSTTGTIKLKARFANSDDALYANQFVQVRLQLETVADSLVVPTSALQRGARGQFVYLIGADNTVSIKPVQAGDADGPLVSVRGELQPGDKVVTDGSDRLRNGSKVEIVTGPPAGASDRGGDRPGKRATSTSPAEAPTKSEPAKADSPKADAKPEAKADTAKPDKAAKPDTPKAAAAAGERPAWMSRLSPEEQEAVEKMSPAERDAWLNKRLDDRARQSAEKIAKGDYPPWWDRLPPEMADKVLKMSPAERQAWLKKRMEERMKQGQ